MKNIIVLLFFVTFSFSSYAGDEARIREVVNKWNELHNNGSAEEFLDLYTPTVYFYGFSYSRERCYDAKKKFLGDNFSQQIISEIGIEYYDNGNIKCDFTKEVNSNGKIKQHRCYLVLKKYGSRYLVSGESDYQSDEKRGTTPDLGTLQETHYKRNLGLIIGLAVALLTTLFFLFRKKLFSKKNIQVEQEPNVSADSEKTMEKVYARDDSGNRDLIQQVKNELLEELKKHISTASPEEQKGLLFENYVIERFSKDYFELKEWRSDKFHKGFYASSNKYPDLEYNFRTKYFNKKFAVECKWRASFYNNKIDWAEEYQFNNYKRFQHEENMRVFLLLGVGGLPSDPETVYIVPLDEIRSVTFYKNQLEKYKRYKKSFFFLDGENMRLE